MTEREYQHLLNTIKKCHPYPSLMSTKEYLELDKDIQIVKNLRFLTDTVECSNCKKTTLRSYTYCPYCGNKLEKEK